MTDYEDIALKFARQRGYDTIRKASEKGGYKYFHFFRKSDYGHKLGWPHIVKISSKGECEWVNDFSEMMWASHQEVVLNNLGDSREHRDI